MRAPAAILYLGEDQIQCQRIRAALQQEGIDAHYCAAALGTFAPWGDRESFFDIIFVDYAMLSSDRVPSPAFIGERWPHTAIIVVSDNDDEELVMKTIEFGASDCILRNDLSRLRAVVRRALRETASRRSQARRERELREGESNFRSIVEQTSEIIYVLPPDGDETRHAGNVLFMSPKAEEILGHTLRDLAHDNRLFFDAIHPDDREAAGEAVRKVLANKVSERFEYRLKRKGGGAWHWVEDTLVSRVDTSGQVTAVLGIMRDLPGQKSSRQREEERQRLKAQLLHSQKLEAVGQLAGGVAHDFNNILTAIIGFGSLLQMRTQADATLNRTVEQILSAAERAATLTQGLLAFSRKQVLNPAPVSVNDIINRVEKLLSRIIGEDIELRCVLHDRPLTVMADCGQVEQVLMNLCANARDAMPRGGLLTVETTTVIWDEEYVRALEYGVPGEYVLLAVTDTGDGMDKETVKRIFEPFFTTKEQGKGTGLGLSMAYGIIKQHNGYINVYSEKGSGSTFKIYLPLIDAPAGEIKASTCERPRGGTETVLLAEDDDDVRAMFKSVLLEFGYRVIEAVDGEDALRKFHAAASEIGLILLDVIMPRKNGKEVYCEITQSHPGVKALFMSGYPADIVHTRCVLEEKLHFLSKPVPPSELLKKVREVLDA